MAAHAQGAAKDEDQSAAEAGTEAEIPQEADLDRSIRNYMLGTMGVCLVPAPLLDLAAITGLQLKMLSELAEAYEVPFKENLGRSLLFSLVGTLGAGHLAVGAFGSLMKLVPGVGHLAAALTQPVLVGAATYALGKVFKMHFALGGTLLDFDAEKMREHFRAEFDAGVSVAKAANKEKAKA